MDFRYALILLDFQHNISDSYTPDIITSICMHMKKSAKYVAFDKEGFIIDGIVLCTTTGIHIVLFDMNSVSDSTDCEESVELLNISNNVHNLYVMHGLSNMPICAPDYILVNTDIPTEWPALYLERLGLRQPNQHLDRTMTYQSIDWNKTFLPVYGSFIDLPENTVLWRGYDAQYAPLSNRPVYFGDRLVAEEYVKTSDTHALGLFATTRPLKLLDIRFLKVLLTDLLYEHTGNAVQKTTVAFGLCSFYHQLRLMELIYADAIRKGDPGYNAMRRVYKESVIEQPGVRVAETSNDGWVMAFLAEVFDGVADGFISPKLFTPYNANTGNILHPELIVFNPIKSGIVQLNKVPPTVTVSVEDLIRDQYASPILLRARNMETKYVGCGRNDYSKIYYVPPIETFNDLLNRGNTEAIKQYREAVKEGKKMQQKVVFSKYITETSEVPTLPTRRLD